MAAFFMNIFFIPSVTETNNNCFVAIALKDKTTEEN